MTEPPPGYLGADARIDSGPAPELVAAGYAAEIDAAEILHRGLALADLAHVLHLGEAGVIPRGAGQAIAALALEWLDVPAAEFPYDPVYGDPYNSREQLMRERLGDAAGWVHLGRTRREAGRIAFRLALRDRLLDLHAATRALGTALCDRAEATAEVVWADTTYLQPAQPSTFGHYLGAFAEPVLRNLRRVEDACAWADVSPAGSGGVGGPRVPYDRDAVAATLGFSRPSRNTRDGMWSTDGLVDAAVAAVQSATVADQLAEDFEVFASPAFGYVELDASLCRASVLMPQKRNPYALAVIRSGAGVLIGRATGLMVTQRAPSARTDTWLSAYREVVDALDVATRVTALGARVVGTLAVKADALAASAGSSSTGAADLAEELAMTAGLDYRSAYRVVGRAVARLDPGADLSAAAVRAAASDLLGVDLDLDDARLRALVDPGRIARSRAVPGGSAPESVRAGAREARIELDRAETWAVRRAARQREAEDHLVARARAWAAAP